VAVTGPFSAAWVDGIDNRDGVASAEKLQRAACTNDAATYYDRMFSGISGH
jgi:hypothetical protein